jgi:hypothetical protein
VGLTMQVYLEDAGFDWKILGPDVTDFDYVAWQCDQDAYAATGQKCSAQSILFQHSNWVSKGEGSARNWTSLCASSNRQWPRSARPHSTATHVPCCLKVLNAGCATQVWRRSWRKLHQSAA